MLTVHTYVHTDTQTSCASFCLSYKIPATLISLYFWAARAAARLVPPSTLPGWLVFATARGGPAAQATLLRRRFDAAPGGRRSPSSRSCFCWPSRPIVKQRAAACATAGDRPRATSGHNPKV